MDRRNEPTEYKQQLKDRILECAINEFRIKGIKAVKMDDLAAMLVISKRTLYEIYRNKELLLLAVVKAGVSDYEAHMSKFMLNTQASVISTIVEFYRYQMQLLTSISPAYFADIDKYPLVTRWLEKNRQKNNETANQFFQEGVRQGFFREDVDYSLISEVGHATMSYIMRKQVYNRYGMKQILHDVIMLYIRGFCTIKGIEAMEKELQT
ncbi:MAG: TetR/AcrR family transcriptional regulator [Prevotella sp.]|jgi:transcriptional regulator, tetR family